MIPTNKHKEPNRSPVSREKIPLTKSHTKVVLEKTIYRTYLSMCHVVMRFQEYCLKLMVQDGGLVLSPVMKDFQSLNRTVPTQHHVKQVSCWIWTPRNLALEKNNAWKLDMLSKRKIQTRWMIVHLDQRTSGYLASSCLAYSGNWRVIIIIIIIININIIITLGRLIGLVWLLFIRSRVRFTAQPQL